MLPEDLPGLVKTAVVAGLFTFLATYLAIHAPAPRQLLGCLAHACETVRRTPWRETLTLVLSTLGSLLKRVCKGIFWILTLPLRFAWRRFQRAVNRALEDRVSQIEIKLRMSQPPSGPLSSSAPDPGSPTPPNPGPPDHSPQDGVGPE
jgi:hypothetical protein